MASDDDITLPVYDCQSRLFTRQRVDTARFFPDGTRLIKKTHVASEHKSHQWVLKKVTFYLPGSMVISLVVVGHILQTLSNWRLFPLVDVIPWRLSDVYVTNILS